MRPLSQNQTQLELFEDLLPYKPYCSDSLEKGLRITNKAKAIDSAYIQLNQPSMQHWLAFDVDQQHAAVSWDDANLPSPAWTAQNPANGHAHIVYGLKSPVCKTELGRAAPIRYLSAIQEGYRKALGADAGYSGLITKNPLCSKWRIWIPDTTAGIYELSYLAEFVKLESGKRAMPVGLGRNCTLFDDLRRWAYKEVETFSSSALFAEAVAKKATDLNSFIAPLPLSEVKATSNSVTKWVWSKYRQGNLSSINFRAVQANRGRQKGLETREQGLMMLRAGEAVTAVSAELAVSIRTVQRWRVATQAGI